MNTKSEEKLGWRQCDIRTVMKGRGEMALCQISSETAMLCIDLQRDSLQDAIDYLAARDGYPAEVNREPKARIHWWRTDTGKSLHNLVRRGLVAHTRLGYYKWID